MHKAPTADRRRRPTRAETTRDSRPAAGSIRPATSTATSASPTRWSRGAAEAPTQGWRLAETPRLRPAAA